MKCISHGWVKQATRAKSTSPHGETICHPKRDDLMAAASTHIYCRVGIAENTNATTKTACGVKNQLGPSILY